MPFAADLDGHGQEMDLDAFLQGLLHLLGVGGHLRPGAPVGDVHLLAPQPDAGAGRVHGGIAAADDDHLAAGILFFNEIDVPQEGNDVVHLGKVGFTLDLELVAQVGPDAHEEGLVALRAEIIQGDVPAHGDAGVKLPPPCPSAD